MGKNTTGNVSRGDYPFGSKKRLATRKVLLRTFLQAGKQASRQAGKQASRQAGKQASRQADKQTSRQADRTFVLQSKILIGTGNRLQNPNVV